jgi:accessory colonization factor AcfC
VLAASSRAQEPLRVRTTPEVAPCVAAASPGWSGGKVVFETVGLREPGPVDVLVGTSVEMTRALEGGQGVVNSDVDVAAIPWVLTVASGNPLRVRSLADVREKGVEVMVLGGPAAYEARRALAGAGTSRVRESTDRQTLRASSVALVPLSLAGSGERIAVPEVPALRVAAAIAVGAAQVERAEQFVRYLGSEAGQRAFAACGSAAGR